MAKEISLLMGKVVGILGDYCAEYVQDIIENKLDGLWEKPQILYKRTVIYFISDFVEFISPEKLQPVVEKLAQALFASLNMEDAAIMQGAYNALGIIGSKSSSVYAPYVDLICNQCIQHIQSLTENNTFRCARDNCLAALIKTAHIHGKQEYLRQAFSYLPIEMDRVEGITCHEIFVKTLEQNQTFILGEDYSNLPQVVKLFLTLYIRRNEICSDITIQFITGFFQQLTNLPQETLQHLQQNLSSHEEELLRTLLQSSVV